MKDVCCRKCGQKLDSDAEYCPKCGNRLNDYGEVQSIEKSKRTRNILLIVLAIVVIGIACIFSYSLFFNEQYQMVQVSPSASLEMPIGKGLNSYYINGTSIYQVDNGKGVTVVSYNSNNVDLASAVGFAAVKEMAVGSRFNENQVYQTTVNGSTVWSIATYNESTHDNIIISSHDKDLTLRMYNSIKYSANANNSSNNTVQHVNTEKIQNNNQNNEKTQVNNERKILASDGKTYTMEEFNDVRNSHRHYDPNTGISSYDEDTPQYVRDA